MSKIGISSGCPAASSGGRGRQLAAEEIGGGDEASSEGRGRQPASSRQRLRPHPREQTSDSPGVGTFEAGEKALVAHGNAYAVDGCPGWDGAGELRYGGMTVQPVHDAPRRREGHQGAEPLYGQRTPGKSQGDGAGHAAPEQGGVAPQAERDAEGRPPRPGQQGQRTARRKGNEEAPRRRPQRDAVFQRVAGGEQRAGQGVGGQARRIGAEGKRGGGNGLFIKGPVPQHESDQRQGHRRQPSRSRKVEPKREQQGPLDFGKEGGRRGSPLFRSAALPLRRHAPKRFRLMALCGVLRSSLLLYWKSASASDPNGPKARVFLCSKSGCPSRPLQGWRS